MVKVTTKLKNFGMPTLDVPLMTGEIELGVVGTAADDIHPSTDLSVGEVAAVHEFGLVPGAPKRAWLSGWIDANRTEMQLDSEKVGQAVLKGKMTSRQALHLLGKKWSKAIRDNIRASGVTPELSLSTIKRKGSDVPLIHTETLVKAIGYIVRKVHNTKGK